MKQQTYIYLIKMYIIAKELQKGWSEKIKNKSFFFRADFDVIYQELVNIFNAHFNQANIKFLETLNFLTYQYVDKVISRKQTLPFLNV